jgi:diphthamide synthase (EF-2-diphthine--ammonia ligase)
MAFQYAPVFGEDMINVSNQVVGRGLQLVVVAVSAIIITKPFIGSAPNAFLTSHTFFF